MKELKFDINDIRIASPCRVRWSAMKGSERTRHCSLCNLNVYNISEMTDGEVADLIAAAEGRICARIYRRADGTVLTKDCPVGLKGYYRKTARYAATALAAILGLAAVSFGQKDEKISVDVSRIKILKIKSPDRKGTLSGIVKDEIGSVILDVVIVLTGSGKNKFRVVSDDDGRYQVSLIPPGTYILTTKFSKVFKNIEIVNLKIAPFETAELNITVPVGQNDTELMGDVIMVDPVESSVKTNDKPRAATKTMGVIELLPRTTSSSAETLIPATSGARKKQRLKNK
jgi:Carboxypeptidase regulatory-like domain